MSDDSLKDSEGNFYERNWAGNYEQKWDFWKQQPARGTAQGLEGSPSAHSWDGTPLYRNQPGPVSSGGSSGGDAAGALLGILVLIAMVWIISALFGLVARLLTSLVNQWRDLEQRYPRATLAVKLAFVMVAVGLGLALAGFDPWIQIAGAALVPGVWGWIWLTRKLPVFFLPINALIAGIVLLLVARATNPYWLPTWSGLTFDLPLLRDLSVVLAVLPMVFLGLWAGGRRFPRLFTPINLFVLGGLLWFVLMRIWTDWIPLWSQWTQPVPLIPSIGWLIVFAPLGFWLWRAGQNRWPLPFFGAGLLLFGALLGLTAYHQQPAWITTWKHWTAGLPFTGIPIAVVGLTPVALWGWNRISLQWPRIFVIPNLLITGALLWLILDRTRSAWEEPWHLIWGEVPFALDLAIIVLVVPVGVWAWRQSGRRWRHVGSALRALLIGLSLWWLVERTRPLWEHEWKTLTGSGFPDLAALALAVPLLIWSWNQVNERWPRAGTASGLVAVSLSAYWLTSLPFPEATLAFRFAVGLIPLAAWGWNHFVRRRPKLGWMVALLPLLAVGLLAWLMPGQFESLMAAFGEWLSTQGVTIPVKGT